MLVLASSSPRRKQLLKMILQDFIIYSSEVEEIIEDDLTIEEIPGYLSKIKAEAVFKHYPNDLVLGADTIVTINNQVLGKPKSKEDAFKMLKTLSNKTHKVITSFALINKEKSKTYSSISEVEFFDLSDEQIFQYLENDEYIGKAGAYAIQGKAALFVKNINGDFFSIMGLPVALLNKALKEFEFKN